MSELYSDLTSILSENIINAEKEIERLKKKRTDVLREIAQLEMDTAMRDENVIMYNDKLPMLKEYKNTLYSILHKNSLLDEVEMDY